MCSSCISVCKSLNDVASGKSIILDWSRVDQSPVFMLLGGREPVKLGQISQDASPLMSDWSHIDNKQCQTMLACHSLGY